MDYNLKIGDETAPIEVESEGDGKYKVVIYGEVYDALAMPVSPNHLHVQYTDLPAQNIYVAETDDGMWVWINGKARFVQDADTLSTRKRGGGEDSGPKEVTPDTPANVISVLCETGQTVAKGDKLVVVSAMKMETTLTAPYAGTVTKINTEPGAKAMPGDILVEIEPDETEEDDE